MRSRSSEFRSTDIDCAGFLSRHSATVKALTVPRAGIVIVANRGPNDFVWDGGAWITRTATGGLVSMLTPLARRASVTWFCCVSEPPDAQQARHGLFTTAADQTDPRLHVVPVPLPAEV